jgi:Na+-translocating ferredoxin:NAD+ oxidoreductase RnfD subunit
MSVPARNGWMLLALSPGMHGRRVQLLLAIACFCVCVLAIVRATNRVRDNRNNWHRNAAALLLLEVSVVFWLPPNTPWWTTVIAMATATLLMQLFADRQGGSPFHPAMVGCAIALMCNPHAIVPSGDDNVSWWVAAAYGLGGVALICGRCIHWQALLATLAGAGLIALLAQLLDRMQSPAIPIELLPAFALTAVFIASDPSSGCVRPRARLVFGFGLGVLGMLSMLFSSNDVRALLGLAGAVLLMNAMAPWLDRISERPAHASRRTDAGKQ